MPAWRAENRTGRLSLRSVVFLRLWLALFFLKSVSCVGNTSLVLSYSMLKRQEIGALFIAGFRAHRRPPPKICTKKHERTLTYRSRE